MTPVFVPLIGFRPGGTRTLRESVEATQEGTRLIVHALAAAPDRTDVVVEWLRNGNPATCPPESKILLHSNRTPLAKGLAAELVTGPTTVDALSAERRGYHVSHSSIGAIDALRFPALPADLDRAELRLRDGPHEWRVPFSLVLGVIAATPLRALVAQDGVVIRAAAMCRYEDELVVDLEVLAAIQIRQVAGPVPSAQRFVDTQPEDQAARKAEMRRVFGERATPITLEDDRGRQHDEVRRLLSPDPQQAGPGHSFTSRFCVMFDAPNAETRGVALVIPFIELNDFGPSTTVDLRELPRDVALAEHRFRVAALEQHRSDDRRILLELAPSSAAPRFVQPARVHGSEAEFGWQREAVDRGSTERGAIWMTTRIGDPPVVTFSGVVLRVDGPLRLDLTL